MKNLFLLFMVLLAVTLVSCDSEADDIDLTQKIDCDKFVTGLLTFDNDKLKTEFVKITSDCEPIKTAHDQIGHQENFHKIVEELNKCDLISSQLLCYACIETYPPQSELLVTIDSSGQSVKRIIDILTPSDSILSFVRVHEYISN